MAAEKDTIAAGKQFTYKKVKLWDCPNPADPDKQTRVVIAPSGLLHPQAGFAQTYFPMSTPKATKAARDRAAQNVLDRHKEWLEGAAAGSSRAE